MKFTIEITDDELKEALIAVISKKLANEYTSDTQFLKKAYSDAIKDIIYEPKTKKQIIEKTVDKASAEIKRKAMPLIMEMLEQNE